MPESIGAMDPSGSFYMNRLRTLKYWMVEREAIRKKRAAGKPAPWTSDPILQGTRFCNVRRMDDKVSEWLQNEWYPPVADAEPGGDLLATAGLARLINWPLALVGLKAVDGAYTRWDYKAAKAHFETLKKRKEKVFTGAYIINAASGGKGANKVDVVLKQVNTLFHRPDLVDPDSMQETHSNLQKIHGIGSFIAGQIVADLRHVWPGMWEDRHLWAPLGPGSRRGIAWLQGWNGIDKLPRMSQEDFNDLMQDLMAWASKNVSKIYEERQLEAHDIQNVLCETDKYNRLTFGTGRAKNKFAGG